MKIAHYNFWCCCGHSWLLLPDWWLEMSFANHSSEINELCWMKCFKICHIFGIYLFHISFHATEFPPNESPRIGHLLRRIWGSICIFIFKIEMLTKIFKSFIYTYYLPICCCCKIGGHKNIQSKQQARRREKKNHVSI